MSEFEMKKDTNFEHFFGINLKHSPNAQWSFDGEKISSTGNKIRDFSIDLQYNLFFQKCRAKVIGNNATNFFFQMPYNSDSMVSIIFIIERDYVHDGVKTQLDAILKYSGRYEENNYNTNISWEIGDDVTIELSRDISTGDIRLNAWTMFYNNEIDTLEEFSKSSQNRNKRKANLAISGVKELDTIAKRNEEISSVCVEVVSEMSSLKVAQNCLLSKTQSVEEIYFVLTSENDSIIARNPYTHDYYFTAYSHSLKSLLESGANCLGFVSDVDANDATQLIFEISFMIMK